MHWNWRTTDLQEDVCTFLLTFKKFTILITSLKRKKSLDKCVEELWERTDNCLLLTFYWLQFSSMATPYIRVSGKCSVVIYSRRGDSKSLPNSNHMEHIEKKILFQCFTKCGWCNSWNFLIPPRPDSNPYQWGL